MPSYTSPMRASRAAFLKSCSATCCWPRTRNIHMSDPDTNVYIVILTYAFVYQPDEDKPCCFPDIIKWHFLLYNDRYNEIADQNMHMGVSICYQYCA